MRTRERTRKLHRNTTKGTSSYVSQQTHQHSQRTLHNGRNVLFSSTVLQPTLTRTINGNTSLALPKDADTETSVRGRRELRQYTWRTDAREHQSSVSNPLRTNEHTKFALPTMCEHKTRHTAQTPPQTKHLCFAVRCCRLRYSTKPHTQTLFVQ